MRVQQMLHDNAQLLLTPDGRKELKWLIAPLVCNDAKQQQQFYDIYEEYISKDIYYSKEEIARLEREAALEKREADLENQKLSIKDDFQKTKEGNTNWSKWLYVLIPALLALLTICYLIYEALQPKPVIVEFAKSKIEVRVGDTLTHEDIIDTLYHPDGSLLREDSILWKWKLEGDSVNNKLEWSHKIKPNSTYKNNKTTIEILAFEKETNILLGGDTTELLIKCKNGPKTNSSIIVTEVVQEEEEQKGQFFIGDTIDFKIEFEDASNWIHYWEIENQKDSNQLETQHVFNKAGEYTVKFHIEAKPNIFGECDSTLFKTITIDELNDEDPLHLASFELMKEDKQSTTYKETTWPFLLFLGLLLGSWLFRNLWKQAEKKAKEEQEKLAADKEAEKQKKYKERFAPNDKSPYEIPFRNKEEEIALKNEQLWLANTMRQRQEGLRKNLDIKGTIAATVEQGGFLDLKYATNTRPTDYVVLIDDLSVDSHQARLFKYLTEMLRQQDVLMDVYYYRNNLGQLWNDHHRAGLSLQQVSRLHPHQRLIVMGNAHSLVDDATDESLLIDDQERTLRAWKERLLLTPLPLVSWTYKEARLYSLFPVFPSDLKGLIRAAKFIESGMESEDLPTTLREWEDKLKSIEHAQERNKYEADVLRRWSSLKHYEDYLKDHPDVLKWLKALAVYPEPNWNITIAIGEKLNVPITFDNLMLLARIPWLQKGTFPTRLWREILKDNQFDENEIPARLAVETELKKAMENTEGAFANYQSEINLAVQKFAIAPEKKENKEIINYLITNGLLPKLHQEELDRTVTKLDNKRYNKTGSEAKKGANLIDFINEPEKGTDADKDEKSIWHNAAYYLMLICGTLATALFISYCFFNDKEPFVEEEKNELHQAAILNNQAVAKFYENLDNDTKNFKVDSFYKKQEFPSLRKHLADSTVALRLLEQAIAAKPEYQLAIINYQKLKYNIGVANYYGMVHENKSNTSKIKFDQYANAATSHFKTAIGKDSIYHAALMGLANVSYLKNDKKTCEWVGSILDRDSAFFDTQPVPNVYTKTDCDSTITKTYYLRAIVLDSLTREPIKNMGIALPNRIILTTDKNGRIEKTWGKKPFSTKKIEVLINASVMKKKLSIQESKNKKFNITDTIFVAINKNSNSINLDTAFNFALKFWAYHNEIIKREELFNDYQNDYPLYIQASHHNNDTFTLFDPDAIEELKVIFPKTKLSVNYISKKEWINLVDHLTFGFGYLSYVPKEVFSCLNLKTLDLRYNNLKSIPEQIGQLKNLTELYLSYNELTSIPEQISQLKNLTSLDLYSNQLTSIPEQISRLKNLTSLDLRSNNLKSLPEQISQLKNLTSLYLSSNQLTSLPEQISQLKNLTSLYLSSNQLTRIPEQITQLKNLTSLYLSSNQLTRLPEQITQLKNLTRLDLSDNQLTSLPEQISQLKNLTTLYLSQNQLTSLPEQISQLKNLTTLNLSSNQLSEAEIEKIKRLLPNCKITANDQKAPERKKITNDQEFAQLLEENAGQLYMQFINQYRDIAVFEKNRSGVPASIKMAKALLESEAGKNSLALKANNYFGIKCGMSWKDKTFYLKSDDRDENGKLIEDCYRKYDNSYESFIAHSNFLKENRRYDFLFYLTQTDYKSWANGLQKAGYSRLPEYSKDLIDIIEKYRLDYLDNQQVSKEGIARMVSQGLIEYHFVKQGETMESIAKTYSVNLKDLYSRNRMPTNSRPAIGERIKLSGKRIKAIEQPRLQSEVLPRNPNNSSFFDTPPLPQMVQVKGGTFTMGCTEEQGEDCGEDESPKHQVTLSDFAIGKYEVTNEEFVDFMNEKGNQEEGGRTWVDLEGSRNKVIEIGGKFTVEKGYEKHPMIYVSWYGARTYCKWLSEKTGKNYSLPTEAEWEYSARGGSKGKPTKYAGSDDLKTVGWYDDNSESKTHQVGQLAPNELGIYDMSGNVWEWSSDWYGENYYETIKDGETNPKGPESGDFRVLRGGSWNSFDNYCRVSVRSYYDPDYRDDFNGFRVARH